MRPPLSFSGDCADTIIWLRWLLSYSYLVGVAARLLCSGCGRAAVLIFDVFRVLKSVLFC
jgi:predicted membrane protein